MCENINILHLLPVLQLPSREMNHSFSKATRVRRRVLVQLINFMYALLIAEKPLTVFKKMVYLLSLGAMLALALMTSYATMKKI